MKSNNFKQFSITAFILCILLVSSNLGLVSAKKQHEESTNVLILTNRSNLDESAVFVSLNLDDRINIEGYTAEDDKENGTIQDINSYDFDSYDVVVFDCLVPSNASDADYLFNSLISRNIGILLFGGNYSANLQKFESIIPAFFIVPVDAVNETIEGGLVDGFGFSNTPWEAVNEEVILTTESSTIMTDEVQVAVSGKEEEKDESDQTVFTTQIAWQSCPLLQERVSTYAKKPGSRTIVEVPNTLEPLMVVSEIKNLQPGIPSNASVIFISTGVGDIELGGEIQKMNEPFSLWPYFNYLMYTSAYYLNEGFGSTIETYADWPWSPIPHEKETAIWMIFIGALWVFNFWLFFTLGRKKKKRDQENGAKTSVSEGNPGEDKPESPEKLI